MAKEIKYICDFCGKEIENKNDRADIVFHDVGMTLNVHLSCSAENLDLSKKERSDGDGKGANNHE